MFLFELNSSSLSFDIAFMSSIAGLFFNSVIFLTSKMGDKRIIIIPKDYHSELDKLNPKQVKITIDDEI